MAISKTSKPLSEEGSQSRCSKPHNLIVVASLISAVCSEITYFLLQKTSVTVVSPVN
jgi:hypothetical protein